MANASTNHSRDHYRPPAILLLSLLLCPLSLLSWLLIYIYIYMYMGSALSLLGFWPPCHLQNVTACRRNDRTCIQVCETHTKISVSSMLYYFMAFYITPGVEPRTSCAREPIPTNLAMGATSLRSSCSPSCLPPAPLGKRCGQGSLTIGGNPLLQKGIPYCRR